MGISTHILDTSRGKPASNVRVTLSKQGTELRAAETDADGRVKSMLPDGHVLEAGTYRLTFDVAAYFTRLEVDAFYPQVSIDFVVKNPSEHFHVPLLLQPFGFATYRGS